MQFARRRPGEPHGMDHEHYLSIVETFRTRTRRSSRRRNRRNRRG